MAAYLTLRRGASTPSLLSGEPFLNETDNTFIVGLPAGSMQVASVGTPNTGDFEVIGNITAGNGSFSGTVDVTGDIILGGSIILGDTPADQIEVNAVLSGSLVPTAASVFNIGANSTRYNTIYADNINITNGITASALDYNDVTGKPTLVSGSSQIDLTQATNWTGSANINHADVSVTAGDGLSGGGAITQTRTLTLDTGSTHFIEGVSTIAPSLPSGTVSGSSQLTSSYDLRYALSGSGGGAGELPTGVVSGSSQIDITAATNYSSINQYTDTDNLTYMNSIQVLSGSLDFGGLISGSSQVSFTGITDKPTLVSGSDQVSGSFVLKTGGTFTGGIVGTTAQFVNTVIGANATASNEFVTKQQLDAAGGEYYVGNINPTGNTYPSLGGESTGAYWIIAGLGTGVDFTYTTGDLSGSTVQDGYKEIYNGTIIELQVPPSTAWGNIAGSITSQGDLQTELDSKENIGNGVVSGSSQITFTDISGIPTLVSGSAQVSYNGITDKPTLVSGSSQIDVTATTNYSNINQYTDADTLSYVNSLSVLSGSISFNEIADVPATLVSGSSQITLTSGQVTDALTFTPYNSTNPNGYTANTGTVTSVGTSAPLTGTVSTSGNLSITQATTSTNGYLTSTDWNTFNNKTSNTGTVSSVTAGNGLNFTTITGAGAVTMGTPSTISGVTSNSVSSTSHTHAWSNTPGYTTNTGTVTSVGTNAPLTGTVSTSGNLSITQATTSTSGYLSSTDWNTFNNKGSGTVTSVATGTGLDGSFSTSGTITLDLNELASGGTLVGTDSIVAVNGTATQKQLISSIPLSIFNNNSGWTSNTGTVTSVTGGTGVDSTGGTTPSITLDVNELAVGGTLVGTDHLIAANGTVSNKQLISSIPLSIFNNNSGWTSNTGDITGVTAGNGITGGATSGTATVTLGTPGSLTASTTNAVTSTSHTHAITGFLKDTTDTLTGDLTVTGTLNVRTAIDLADNDILRFGSGDDCEFFCNGSHMYMDLNSGIGNFYIRDGSTTRFTFDDAGALTATGDMYAVDFNLSSDIRLKKKVKLLKDYKITTNWSKWNWKSNNKKDIGLIADDLEKTNPEFVKTGVDGMKSVAYTKVLVAKMIEKDNQIEDLTKRIEKLEKLINTLI